MRCASFILSVYLLSLAFMLSACRAAPAASSAPDAQPPAPYRFSLLLTGDPLPAAWGEDAVSRALEQRFGVQIDVTSLSLDVNRTLLSLGAADSMPDALHLRRDDSFLRLIEQGRLLPLDPYLERYDGYRASISPRALEMSRVRDQVYALLSGSTQQPTGSGGWMLHAGLYRALGSPELNTLEDVYNYLLMARSSCASPMLLDSGFDLSQIYVSHGGGRNPGLYNLHVALSPQDGRFVFIGDDPAFAETVLFARRLFTEGLLPPDWFVMRKDQVQALLERGEFALFAAQDLTRYPLAALDRRLNGGVQAIEPPRAAGVVGAIDSGAYNLLGDYGIALSSQAAQPERIFALFDFIASDEGQRLTLFGPPGVLYDRVDENGFPVLRQDACALAAAQEAELGLQRWAYPYMPDYADPALAAANAASAPAVWDGMTRWRTEVFNAHARDVTDLANLAPACVGTERNALLLCEDIYDAYLPRMLCASSDDEALALLDEMNRRVRATGFDFVLRHYDWFHARNIAQHET